jgi:Outer membrane protein beta-barrel domain
VRISRLTAIPVRVVLALCLATLVSLVSSPVRAQPNAGAIVSGSIAAAVTQDATNVSFAGAAGYRFNRVIGLGVELTSIPKLNTSLPGNRLSPYETTTFSDGHDNILFFTTNVRIEIPTTSRRILPFAVGGGGVASTRQEYTIASQPVLPPIVIGGPAITLPVFSYHYNNVTTGLALTLGGGVSILAAQHLSIDVDLRELYVRGNPGGSIGRFGVGASYRF